MAVGWLVRSTLSGATRFLGADVVKDKSSGSINRGLKTVEAGAQGEHKLARGYLPTPTWSLHWMRDAGFARAVGDYLKAEREAVDHEIDVLTEYGPFRRIQIEEQE